MLRTQNRFVTKFNSAEEILVRTEKTHIQINEMLIVPRTAIVDIFDTMGIVCFSDGSAEYFSYECRDNIINYFRTRPKCNCGLFYQRTDDERKFWICKKCSMSKRIKETK